AQISRNKDVVRTHTLGCRIDGHALTRTGVIGEGVRIVMARNRITKDRTGVARRACLRNTAAEEPIQLCRIARVKAPIDRAATGRAGWCRGWCWSRAAGVSARAWARRVKIAEILCEGPGSSLHTGHKEFVATRLDVAEDDVKALIGIILVQTQLKI